MIRDILVLSAHTDDSELGAGGSIVKMIDEGCNIHHQAFSYCDDDRLFFEFKKASKVLGIKNSDVYAFKRRLFSYHRQEILDTMIRLRDNVKPHLVLIPCSSDIHQDHNTIYQEALRCFKHCSILGYNLPWNQISSSKHTMFFSLTQKQVNKKIKALDTYKTQKKRPYFSKQYIKSNLIYAGGMINVKYAEAFEVIRWIF